MKWLYICLFCAIAFFSKQGIAQGALDGVDPCIKYGTQVAEAHTAASVALATSEALVTQWDSLAAPPAEFIPLYVEAVKESLYFSWINAPQTAPLIEMAKQANPQFDAKDFFLKTVYPASVTPEVETSYVNYIFKLDYTTNIRPKFLEQRRSMEQTIAEKKDKYDDSCKHDVVNQLIRVTFGNLILIGDANFKAAEKEKGDIAKAVRAISGISLTDIGKYGIQGGPDSEFSKALNSIGLGAGGDIRLAVGNLVNALNPSNWSVPQIRIDVPKIELPNLGGLPTVNLPNVEVPNIDLPKIDLPEIKIDIPVKIDVPVVELPQIPPVKIELPNCCDIRW